MTSHSSSIRIISCAAAAVCTVALADEPMHGFSAPAAARELALERTFDGGVSAEDLRTWMQKLTSAPNHVGSPHDKANAEFIRDALREWGWDARIETFSVLYPTPRTVLLEMTAPHAFRAKLHEPPVVGDASSQDTANALPPYNVYGADGDVTAELIYVNQGMPADYLELERIGASVKGKIVIVRYGGGWRGLKPKLAAQHGALGCIIYSDPAQDGYAAGEVYPRGGFRPADSVQRGSVLDISIQSGDPLTPEAGATSGAKRLDIKQAKTLMPIPVLPISYADAQELLAALDGPVAPAAWKGALPFTYHVGAAATRVHLKIESDWQQRILYDVIATLRGSELPDEWVIRGNHHDAWVFGATDPMGGHVAWLAEAKSLGMLWKSNWRPRRTLVYASWDGEEPGLLGSTEWAKAHAPELKSKAAIYINTDENGSGTLQVGGSQQLRRFVNQAAASVEDPETGASLTARAEAQARVEAYESGKPSSGELEFKALGSGSDFTPFLQHLGIASVDLSFSGEEDYGVYHSAYDSFDHYRRFVDPDFKYGVALAKTAGRLALRAAQADVPPVYAGDFARAVAGYLQELHSLADSMRASSKELDALLDDGSFTQASNPRRPRSAPARLATVPFLNFAPLDNAVDGLTNAAQRFDHDYNRLLTAGDSQFAAQRARVSALLLPLERSLTYPRGLPGRPWYTHMIYAPGQFTGYAAKTLPGIREAIEERRWEDANRYMEFVAGALTAFGNALEKAIADVPKAGSRNERNIDERRSQTAKIHIQGPSRVDLGAQDGGR